VTWKLGQGVGAGENPPEFIPDSRAHGPRAES